MAATLAAFAESLGHGAVVIAFGLSLGEIVSLVGAALAPGDPDQELGATAEEVHLEREDRHAFFARPVGELSDLPAVGEQGSNPSGVVLERAGGGILSDVNAMQRQGGRNLGGSDISLGQAHLPVADGADFGADELDATFERVLDVVLIPSLAILDFGFAGLFRFVGSHRRARRVSGRTVNIGCS